MKFLRETRLLLCGLIFLCGCSSTRVLRDQDYQFSLNAYRSALPDQALEEFPKKESGGFITSIEKSWLGFWNDKVDVAPLEKQIETLQARKFVSLHREAEVFLFQESEEGYVPSEPEIVVLHLLSSLSYMKLGKWTDAEVEARSAAFFLQNFAPEEQTRFDDPALRVWLAGVWTALGLWNEAQVDLRKAAQMTKDKQLEKLAEAPAPVRLTIRFDGVAPNFLWSNSSSVPAFSKSSQAPATVMHYSSEPWFDRHLKRNTALRDTLVKFNYMAQFLGVKAENNFGRGAGRVGAVTFATAGIAAGLGLAIGAFVYVPNKAGAYLASGGTALAFYFYESAHDWDRRFQKQIDEDEEKTLQSMRTYRLVRYLPEWVSVLPNGSSAGLRAKTVSLSRPGSKSIVEFTNQF